MATIADVASGFMSQSRGVSPAIGAARGFKAGRALGQREEALQQSREALEVEKETFEYEKQKDIAQMDNKAKAELAKRRVGAAIQVMESEQPEQALLALKKHAPDLLPENINMENIMPFAVQHDYAAQMLEFGKDKADQKYKQRQQSFVERESAQKFGLEEKKFGFEKEKYGLDQIAKEQKKKQEETSKKLKSNFDQEDKLRDEYEKLSGDFIKIRDAFTRVEAAAKDSSAAGDLALIFNYMKVLDPGSVVRESEFATAQNAAGIPTRVRNQWNRVLKGERLGDTQRQDFVSRANMLYEGQLGNQKELEGKYTKLAEQYELNPENVVLEFRTQAERDAAPGLAGAVPAGPGAAPAGPGAALREVPGAAAGPSEEDIMFTAQKYGITPDEVRARLGAQ